MLNDHCLDVRQESGAQRAMVRLQGTKILSWKWTEDFLITAFHFVVDTNAGPWLLKIALLTI